MKKTGKRILGLLLAVLMMFQLPFSAFAEELETGNIVVPSYEEETVYDTEPIENDESIEETNSIEDLSDSTEKDLYEEDLSDETDILLEETETEEEQILEEETEVQTEQEEIATLSAEESTEETQEIQVTVSVSQYGEFLNDKDGSPMAGRTVKLTGQASYTMDDALKAAHEQYYPGGAEAGYDYHVNEIGTSGEIYRLWGIDKKDVPSIIYSLNHDSRSNNIALGEKVKDGDELHFFIQQNKERLAFFTQTEQTVTEDQNAVFRLRVANGITYSDCAGAAIYIDGKLQEGLVTDENGQVILSSLEPRDTPYFVTAKKTEVKDGKEYTVISAAYSRLTVLPSGEEDGDYVKNVTLRNVVNRRDDGRKQTEMTLDVLDGSRTFLVPAEYVYSSMSESSNAYMYVSAEFTEDMPEDASAYVVYEDPLDGTVHRTALKKNGFVYLSRAIYRENRNKVIQSLQIEVRRNKKLVEKHTLPVTYKNHLHELGIQDPWGHELLSELEDTTENQQWIGEVPENAGYVMIYTEPYGYSDRYGVRTTKELVINGETVSLDFSQSYQLALDWQAHEEYVIEIRILDDEKLHCTSPASYTVTLKKGGWDYTPEVQIVSSRGRGRIIQGSEAPILTTNVTVTGPNGEVEDTSLCTYQWYYYISDEKGNEIYTKIEGATKSSYTVTTDNVMNAIRVYFCEVLYEKDGCVYSKKSNTKSFRVIPEKVEIPVIEKQPQNIQHVLGKQETVQLEIGLEIEEKNDPFYLIPQYQWYQSTEADTTKGTVIEGAISEKYTPDVSVEGTLYYYCKVKYKRDEYNEDKTTKEQYSYGEEICSNIAKVEVIAEPLPWEGNGSEKNPYQLRSVEDLEALREKVNKDGYSFDGMHFQMLADITLPSGWTPIGALAAGHGLSEDGKYLWPFSGILDGADHTLTMADGGKPLFNYVRNATIQNLKLNGKQIDGYGLVDRYTVDYGTDGNYNTGCPETALIRNITLLSGMSTKKAGLIGGYASGANKVVIENCTAESGVVIGYTGKESDIGTFGGSFNGVIRNCRSSAEVHGNSGVGGLVGSKGQSMGWCTIENSSFTGTVLASGNWVGGIIGSGYEAGDAPNTPVVSVRNCYVAGNVTGATNVGGVFGGEPSCEQCWGNGSGSISNNFFYGTVSGRSNVGAIVGYLKGFDKFQGISNNYYLDTCGASQGIGGIGAVLTVSGNPQDVPYEYDDGYGIDYKFDQALYCFPKTAGEFADGTVADGLNSGNYNNWEQNGSYPSYGQTAYATGMTLTGNYKKEYYVGEELDLSGGIFTVTWSDGTKTYPTANEITVIGYDPNKRGSQMLSLKYGAVETTITVGVILRAGQIEVSFTLLGDSVHDSDADGNCHTLSSQNLETWIPETKMIVSNNAKVKDVLEQALSANGMTCENPKGNYVSAITRNGVKLAEFTNGKNSGWMYTLNGKHPDLGVNEQYLNNGDVIIFHYTDNYVNEEHVHQWSSSWSSNGVVHWHECEWACGQRKDQASHSWSAWKTTKAATYTTAAVQTRYCTVCGREQTQNVGSPLPKPEPKPNPTMQVNVSKITLKYGQSTTGLKVTGLQSGDYVQSYKSSNTAIFTVNGNGKITAKKKAGSATLTITLKSGLSRNVTVTVQKGTVKTTKVSGVAGKITLAKGKKYTVKPVITPFTSQEKVTYSSSNKKVATVTSKGVITAKKSGTAKITVKSGKKKAVLTVTVPKTATKSISVASAVSVKKGKTYTLKAKRTPANSEEKITYSSSNKKVATVTSSGKIKGVKKGTATITVKSGKVTKKVTVTVK